MQWFRFYDIQDSLLLMLNIETYDKPHIYRNQLLLVMIESDPITKVYT